MSRSKLSRRSFLSGMGAALSSHALLGCRRALEPGEGVPVPVVADPGLASRTGRPNIVFIFADDHRWDHLGCMGHPFLKTPHLDRLATEGVRFDNAFVTTSLCSPSRGTCLTGEYARSHGIQNNLTPWSADKSTFFEPLARAGYRNAFIGKWHMPGRLPALRGVERFITFTVQGGQGRYFDCPLIIDGVETPRPDTYITTDLTDLAIDFIERVRKDPGEAPFCLFLSHKAAHHQFLPPPDLDDLYADVDLDHLPPESFALQTLMDRNLWEGALGSVQGHYRNYCETLTALDREVGRLLDRLDALGIGDDTVVVYSSDNGYSWGEHVLNGKRWASEENMRVPMIVRHRAGLPAPGRRQQEMVLNVDLAPLFLDTAGVAVPERMQGRSFAPLLHQQSTSWRDAFLYEYFRDFPYNVPTHVALRTERHLYVEYERGRDPELFDVVEDPRTMRNLIHSEAGRAIVPDLQRRLRAEERRLS